MAIQKLLIGQIFDIHLEICFTFAAGPTITRTQYTIMNILDAFRRTRRIRKIRRLLDKPGPTTVKSMLDKNNPTKRAVRLLREMWATDELLVPIIGEHTVDDIEEIFRQLMVSGAGQVAGDHGLARGPSPVPG